MLRSTVPQCELVSEPASPAPRTAEPAAALRPPGRTCAGYPYLDATLTLIL